MGGSPSDPSRLGIQPPPQFCQLLLPAGEERLGLTVRGVIVIDQSGELRGLMSQSDELGLLSVNGLTQANGGLGNFPPLVFAQRAEDVRVVSVQRVPGDVGRLAQGTDGQAFRAIRGARREGCQGLPEPISG